MSILPIAAPSCVLPDTIIANTNFLATKVQEVGLCFFELKGSLAYTDEDLPLSLASLPLRWHIHLPVDLPWEDAHKAAELTFMVAQKALYLKPNFAVLHPPTGTQDPKTQTQLLYNFAKTWYNNTQIPLLLENINHAPLANLDPQLFSPQFMPFGICLDVGHMIGFRQAEIILQSNILDYVGLVHWSAPGKKDEHLPLQCFSPEEHQIAQNLVKRLPRTTCHMLEIFNWLGIEQSYPVLAKLLEHVYE